MTQIETFTGSDGSEGGAVTWAQTAANAWLAQHVTASIVSIAAQTIAVYDQGYAAAMYTHVITIVYRPARSQEVGR
jgi:hypothetical protein